MSGVAGGKSDSARENGLAGDCSTAIQVSMGIMRTIITGTMRFCASRISLHAAPTAMNMEPNMSSARSWKRKNHAKRCPGT